MNRRDGFLAVLCAGVLLVVPAVSHGEADQIFFSHSSVAIRAVRTVEIATGVIDTSQDVSPEFPQGVALDLVEQKVYWAETGPNDVGPERIRRKSLDGSGSVEDMTPVGLNGPRGLEIDPVERRLYFADFQTGVIGRMGLDGSGVETIATVSGPTEIALDLIRRKLYFVHGAATKIGHVNLDGTEIVEDFLIASEDRIDSLALDVLAGHVYFSLRGCVCSTSAQGKIQRVHFGDASNPEDFLAVLPASPLHLEIDSVARWIYWSFTGTIQRSSLNGGGQIETIIDGLAGLSGLNGINFFALNAPPPTPQIPGMPPLAQIVLATGLALTGTRSLIRRVI